jgi:hypothetical protein
VPNVKCKICDKSFYTKPSWLLRGYGIYCSSECQYKGMRTGKIIKCNVCGKEAYKTKKALRVSKSGKFFCSKSCQTLWRNQEFVGPKHINWKNGLYAYRSVLSRNKIVEICMLCKINDRRVLSVHHIDKDRKNNLIKNLAWLCHNCHHLVHHHKEEENRFKKNLKIK